MKVYQKLYEAYREIGQQKNNLINNKLIDFLGEEMKNIFEAS